TATPGSTAEVGWGISAGRRPIRRRSTVVPTRLRSPCRRSRLFSSNPPPERRPSAVARILSRRFWRHFSQPADAREKRRHGVPNIIHDPEDVGAGGIEMLLPIRNRFVKIQNRFFLSIAHLIEQQRLTPEGPAEDVPVVETHRHY